MNEQTVYLDGRYMPLAEARIPVLDRGFIFGDGVYEVVPVYARRPFRWPQHRARLGRSLAAIRIADPLGEAGWDALVAGLVARHPWPEQFVYIQVTRGVAPRAHAFPAESTPTVFAMSSELKPPAAELLGKGISLASLPDERWLHCDIKSTSLLGNVLARQAAIDAGANECVMFRDGFLTEGAASNVWVVRHGAVCGVPAGPLALEGIRVGLIESLCAIEGIPFERRRIHRDEVVRADELMISSATQEILPVTLLDGEPVGDGRPGPLHRRLHQAYQRAKSDPAIAGWS
ncbi:MAG: D-amino acid aminotransferase [Burkholderiaceae bacterium]